MPCAGKWRAWSHPASVGKPRQPLSLHCSPTGWCLPWGWRWGRQKKQGPESSCAREAPCAYQEALPRSQLGATRGKRLLTRAQHDTSAFPTTWADVCESQPRAPTPAMNSQMGGVSSQDSRSPKNKARRYTVMQRLSRGVEPEDLCLDASICRVGLWYSPSSIELLREHEA